MFQYPITREKLEEVRGELAAAGFKLAGDDGHIEIPDPVFQGKTIGLAYNFTGEALQMVVTHHQWLERGGEIEAEIIKRLDAATKPPAEAAQPEK